ncbi:glycoside hydrolase family 15 protein [Croceitalea sp. MTPC9]|uniref:glycoside hydrolase family 15 protein n=1 Tax=unclassified Croceitalea TaxID=2632280 RepID=UPI002B3A951B|nr:glycoside hydrolase family 15 protein [Croceitalea sp. MTPC6]GMN15368.1 glycoside hydrolase family 15 protein [Croceitalea sp. MTPC9]
MNNLDYGIIGNCRSAALVSKSGAIEWCCLPEFDSPSVFGKLLDNKIGGSFEIIVDDTYTIEQRYKANTAILITSFSNGENSFEIYDFMPRYRKEGGKYYAPPEIIRYVMIRSGKPRFKVKYNPKLNYAKDGTESYIKPDFIASLSKNGRFETVFLYTSFDKEKVLSSEELEITEDGYFLMAYNEKIFTTSTAKSYLDFERTKVYWLNWCSKTPNYKRYNEEISRSAITLKLLSYDKSGAVLAAATTSLPETIGEVRNWDYRFCWIRDASMVIKVVSELGHENVARRYLKFIINTIPNKAEKLQIMYGINGEKKLTEGELEHLAGYEGSKPVRIGNAAYMQKQNDIYGILMDVIYQQLEKFSTDIENGEELWTITKGIVWIVSESWREPDKGIWEFRTEDRHFTFSKVLCWTALNRAIKVAEILGKKHKIEKWKPLEEEIWNDIYENAWNDEVGAYTQSYGSKHLDASVLLMEAYGCVDAKDERFIKTVHAIEKDLCHKGLLYRYKNEDDFGLPSSSFTVCSFWFVNALIKIGERKKAREMFDDLLSYSNHLGLFSEDLDFNTKRLLGNFPQAYSHLALIECALNFSRKEKDEKIWESMN